MNSFFQKMESLRDKTALASIDVEFCRFLSETEPGIHESVLLAGCLVSAAYRGGDVCILMEEVSHPLFFEESGNPVFEIPNLKIWVKRLSESSVVGKPGEFKPLILDKANRLYFQKHWFLEQKLAEFIIERTSRKALPVDIGLLKDGIKRLFKDNAEQPDWQKIAVSVAMRQLFTVISGGPGTGKTSTVMRLLILLLEQGRQRSSIPAIALAAPTGKAAIRMQESIKNSRKSLPIDEDIKAHIPAEAVTLHHLLGASRHTTQFRYHEENPLLYDCVIVDEASMVDQTLMARLAEALSDKTRLVLLGDKDQLASVEAGSVFGDICGDSANNGLTESMSSYLGKLGINLQKKKVDTKNREGLASHINLLKKSYRFPEESGIDRLVKAINSGNPEEVWRLLNNEHFPDVMFTQFTTYQTLMETLSAEITHQFSAVRSAQSPAEMLDIYGEFKILGAHRMGPWGVETINRELEQILQKQKLAFSRQNWYDGRPVIINTNNYSLKLNNGDIGVCIKKGEEAEAVYFNKGDEGLFLPLSRLPAHSTAYALTVHKSQGSEFDEIVLVLPDKTSKLLHRELLYTAVSRARKKITIVGTEQALKRAVAHCIKRPSGLKDYLWD
jgi:exodeoxyribonuclease V alpha subunit